MLQPGIAIQAVCQAYKISPAELRKQRLNDWVKPVAAALLTQVGGLTQRAVAGYLGLTTGAAVCLQLKRMRQSAAGEHQEIFKSIAQGFTI